MAGFLSRKINSNLFLRFRLIGFGILGGKKARPSAPVDVKGELRVSVIMPTYNRSHFLDKAIASFLKQDYKNSELIILNNGSLDNTREVLSKYASQVRVIHRDKNNIRDAINVLWKASAGDLICLLFDDDEFFDEHSLSLRVREFERNKLTEVVYGGIELRDFEGKNGVVIYGEAPDLQKLLKKEYVNLTSMMWKRSIQDKFMFDEDFEFNGDTLFKIRCLKECRVSAISEPVMAYALHEDQETRRMYNERKYEAEKRLITKKINELYGDMLI